MFRNPTLTAICIAVVLTFISTSNSTQKTGATPPSSDSMELSINAELKVDGQDESKGELAAAQIAEYSSFGDFESRANLRDLGTNGIYSRRPQLIADVRASEYLTSGFTPYEAPARSTNGIRPISFISTANGI